jgi:hypothetical protein
MNICILSDQKHNLFCCYRIAKLTNNAFFIKNPYQQFRFMINGEELDFNFWTNYNGYQNNCYILIIKEEDSNIFREKMLSAIENIKNIDKNYKCILLINIFDSETKDCINMKSKELNNIALKATEKYHKKRMENSSDLLIFKKKLISGESPDDDNEYIVSYTSYMSLDEYINKKKIEFIKNQKNKFIESYVFASSDKIHSIAVNLHNDDHIIKIIESLCDMI